MAGPTSSVGQACARYTEAVSLLRQFESNLWPTVLYVRPPPLSLPISCHLSDLSSLIKSALLVELGPLYRGIVLAAGGPGSNATLAACHPPSLLAHYLSSLIEPKAPKTI